MSASDLHRACANVRYGARHCQWGGGSYPPIQALMPTRPANPCPVCRHLPPCPHGKRQRLPEQRRGRQTYAWTVHARRAIDTHRKLHGDWCPGWGVDPHYATTHNPLTADHVVPLARGGHLLGRLAVLCMRCNARKGDR